MTEMQKAYIAGIVDGEGHIGIAQRLTPTSISYQLRLAVSMTEYSVIQWLAVTTKLGHARKILTAPEHPGRPAYCWALSTTAAIHLIREIQPYLIVKKDHAAIAIEFAENITKPGRRVAPKDFALRQRLMEQLQAKNYGPKNTWRQFVRIRQTEIATHIKQMWEYHQSLPLIEGEAVQSFADFENSATEVMGVMLGWADRSEIGKQATNRLMAILRGHPDPGPRFTAQA